MINAIYAFISAAASWVIALMFIRLKRAAIFYNALIAGAVCASAEYLLYRAGFDVLLPVSATLVFILMMLSIQLQTRGTYGNSVMALLLAKGAESLFRFAKDHLTAVMNPGLGYGLALCVIAAFIAAAFFMRKDFPAPDWRDYFADAASDKRKLNIRKFHVYFALATQCVISSVSLPLMPAVAPEATAALLAAFTFFYWIAVYCALLMIDYRRETLAVLIEQQYRNEVQSFMNIIRSQRHDYNFHVQTLARMMSDGNIDASKKYVAELVRDSIAMNTVLPVRDPAISALINNFRMLAVREGIELHIDIQNDLSHVVTNVYETNKIISNLLQNAIDETKYHQDKSYGIWLYIHKRGEFCVIHVANEFREDAHVEEYIRNIYKHGYSTKLGHDGIGLSSVRTLLERYRGTIYTRVEDKVIHFIVKIPLKYSRNDEDTTSPGAEREE